MADHELELHGKLGIPEFKGFAARIEARYQGTWSTRRSDVAEVAALESGRTVEQLAELLDGGDTEALRDVFFTAVVRAQEVADQEYRAALGRIVAAATDEARVDEAVYLVSQLVKLQPLELRALWMAGEYKRDNGTGEMEDCSRQEATHYRGHRVDPGEVGRLEGVSFAAASAAVDVLIGSGFLTQADPSGGKVTDWGDLTIGTTLGLQRFLNRSH